MDRFHTHLNRFTDTALGKGFASGTAVSVSDYSYFERLFPHNEGQILPP